MKYEIRLVIYYNIANFIFLIMIMGNLNGQISNNETRIIRWIG